MRDRAEYVEFVTRHYAALWRTAFLMTGNRHTAEDVVQSALTRAFVHLSRVRRADHPDAYVRRMVVNEAISMRRLRSSGKVELEDVDRPWWSTAVEVGPEDAVAAHQDTAAALALLSDRQRAVVVLRYYEGFSEAEIAGVLGIRPGSVNGHARAGLAALGARLSVDFLNEDRS